MATKINVFNMPKDEIAKLIKTNFSAKRSWWSSVPYSDIHWLNREQDGANFRFKYFRVTADYADTTQITTESLAIKLVCPPASRTFFMKMPCTVNVEGFSEPFEYETLILCSAKVSGVEPYLPSWFSGTTYISNAIRNSASTTYLEHENTIRRTLGFYDIYDSGSRVADWVYWRMGGDRNQFGGIVHRNWTTSQKYSISTRIQQILSGITYGTAHHFNIMDDYPGWETQWSTFYNGYGMGRYETSYFMTYDELPAPLFDYTQTADIIHYINTGIPTGAIEPFTKEPEVEPVTDYATNFVMNISAVDKNTTKISVTSSNRQYIEGKEELVGSYTTYLARDVEQFSYFDRSNTSNYKARQSQGAMTITYNEDITGLKATGMNGVCHMVFGDDDMYDTDGNYNAESNHSGVFKVYLIPDGSSKVNIKIGKVYYMPYPDAPSVELTKSIYGDGYKFTNYDTGESLIVLFKAISLDELKNIIDEGYPYKDDEEDDAKGSDNIAKFGKGLKTYNISDNAFGEVNRTMWTTNWNEVFKSNTIDPLKSIISSKRIPFTVTGVATDVLYLANREIQIGQGYDVTPIKTFDIGSYTIEALYGNFVDIKYARVKVWLPYIRWVELPASEVISRVSRAEVGLKSSVKRLNFKYIVDFVDGSCRCVISVNDTERWCFDGNCGIDVPVTSDHHTQAVSSAVRNTIGSTLKIAGGIATTAIGIASANMMGAIGGAVTTARGIAEAPNNVPTYEYESSTSPSGYIEGAMNKHIMIVIEYPNAYYPTYYEHKYGKPCYLNLSLSQCSGFTKTANVDCSEIPCLSEEQDMIKQLLDSGVSL